jgi:hypothetical protein
MATEEIATILGKPKNSIDALTLNTYLLLLILHARD